MPRADRLFVEATLKHQVGDGFVIMWMPARATLVDDIGWHSGHAYARESATCVPPSRDPCRTAFDASRSADHFKCPVKGIIRLIDVHVDVGVVLLGEIETEFDMCATVIRVILVRWHPADDVASHLHRFFHQHVTAWILQDTPLVGMRQAATSSLSR